MPANPKFSIENLKWAVTRRALLQCTGMGLGSLALRWLLEDEARAEPAPSDPLAPQPTHFRARAKNIIFLHMVGAPSQLDLFDYKATLQEYDGQPCPKHLLEGKRFAFLRGHPSLLGTKFKFAKRGQSGLELSKLLPHLASVV